MSLQSMEYVIAISEEKSLSRAAERLLISQAALSQHVKKLETEWTPGCSSASTVIWCSPMRAVCM